MVLFLVLAASLALFASGTQSSLVDIEEIVASVLSEGHILSRENKELQTIFLKTSVRDEGKYKRIPRLIAYEEDEEPPRLRKAKIETLSAVEEEEENVSGDDGEGVISAEKEWLGVGLVFGGLAVAVVVAATARVIYLKRRQIK